MSRACIFLLLLLLCSSRGTVAVGQRQRSRVESIKEMRKPVGDHKLRYLVQAPAGKASGNGWPLLLFLHGYGECGTDIQKVKKHGPPKLIARFEELAHCVIVSPQCPRDSWWRVAALKAVVDEVVEERGDIDKNRLYVTGLSMGGYGIWSFISHHPDFFAAAIPICGGGNPFNLPNNRPGKKTGITNEFLPDGLTKANKLPIWAFHGTRDGSVPIQETKTLVTRLKDAGSKQVRFTAYENAGHVQAWQKAYNDPKTWRWLFAQ